MAIENRQTRGKLLVVCASVVGLLACGGNGTAPDNVSGGSRVVVYGQILQGGPDGRVAIARLYDLPASTLPADCYRGRLLDAAIQVVDSSGRYRLELRTSSGVANGCVQVIGQPNQFDGAHSSAQSDYLGVRMSPLSVTPDSIQVVLTLPYQS
jgi:hypothetical protein